MEPRPERVLLVIDGDNLTGALRALDVGLDLSAFREVINLACMRYQQGPPKAHTYTPIGPVTEAHIFRTIFPRRGSGEDGPESLQGDEEQLKRRLRARGYVPHVYGPDARGKGYPDSEVIRLMVERMQGNDTLILVTGDSDFWDAMMHVRRMPRRVIYVASEGNRHRWADQMPIPYVDLTRLQINYSQTILPPRRRKAAGSHAA